jgi:hypothetical protein
MATASAGGGVGFLQVSASGSVNNNPDDSIRNETAGATAQAQWGDTFVIDGGASRNGTEGVATFLIGITGGGMNASASDDLTIRPFASATAFIRNDVSLRPNGVEEFFLERDGDVFDSASLGPGSSGESTGNLNGTFSFIFGEAIILEVSSIAGVNVQGEGEASAQFGNTIAWGGLTEVLDASGSIVTDFTANAITNSGVNWALPVEVPTAVPIPPAIWLFGSGLLGLIGIARSRKAA